MINVDSPEASGSWCSVLEDLSEQLEINPEFLLPIASIVFRRIHAHQIHCGLQLLRRRWEAAFHSVADAHSILVSPVRVIVATIHTRTLAVRVHRQRLEPLRMEEKRLRALSFSWIKMKISFHGVTRGN